MNRDEAVDKLVKAGGLSVDYAEDLYDSIIPKPTVPQYVADWVDNSREYDYEFCDFFDSNHQPEEVYRWLNCENRRQSELNALALSTLIVHGRDAVIVEEEPRYTVRVKGIDGRFNWLMYDRQLKVYVFGAFGSRDCQNIFTEKQLSRDGLGYVLYNDAFEVREVE